MKTFLEQGNSIVVAKAELRAYDFAIQFQQPELKPSAPQECRRHLEIKTLPMRIGKRARLAAASPAHLMQAEQCLQMDLQFFYAFTADKANAVTRLQPPGITREQRTERWFQRIKILRPG